MLVLAGGVATVAALGLATPKVDACKLVLISNCKDKVTVVPGHPSLLVDRNQLSGFRATSKRGAKLRYTVSDASPGYAWVTVRARPGMQFRTTRVVGSRCSSNLYRVSNDDYRGPKVAPIVKDITLVDEITIETESTGRWWMKTEWSYSASDLEAGKATAVVDTRPRIPASLLAPGAVDRRLYIRITPLGPDRKDGPAWAGYIDPEQPGFVAGLFN